MQDLANVTFQCVCPQFDIIVAPSVITVSKTDLSTLRSFHLAKGDSATDYIV